MRTETNRQRPTVGYTKPAKRQLAIHGQHADGLAPFGYSSRARKRSELTAAGVPGEVALQQAESLFPVLQTEEPLRAGTKRQRVVAGYVRLTRDDSIKTGLSIAGGKVAITNYAERAALWSVRAALGPITLTRSVFWRRLPRRPGGDR